MLGFIRSKICKRNIADSFGVTPNRARAGAGHRDRPVLLKRSHQNLGRDLPWHGAGIYGPARRKSCGARWDAATRTSVNGNGKKNCAIVCSIDTRDVTITGCSRRLCQRRKASERYEGAQRDVTSAKSHEIYSISMSRFQTRIYCPGYLRRWGNPRTACDLRHRARPACFERRSH